MEILSPEYEEPKYLQEKKKAIMARIDDESIFFEEEQRRIAHKILQRLEEAWSLDSFNTEAYYQALEDLDSLVPTIDAKNRRRIANISITPTLERTIASRLKSENLTPDEEAELWSNLPETVREEIVKVGGMAIQLTDRCTQYCSFCSFSKKGPIGRKLSPHLVEKVISEIFRDRDSQSDRLVSGLYYGSDPFDWKIRVFDPETCQERVIYYPELASMYSAATEGKNIFFTNSTAVPIGEELIVLEFILDAVRHNRTFQTGEPRTLRISRTKNNSQRADHIINLARAITGYTSLGSEDSTVEHTPLREDHAAARGRMWESTESSVWNSDRRYLRDIPFEDVYRRIIDVIGPNCFDSCILTPQGVFRTVAQGASTERPDGEMMFPVLQTQDDGTKVYRIPHRKDHFKEGNKWDHEYPTYSVITIGSDEQVTKEIFTDRNDPHRAFLRLVSALKEVLTVRKTPYINYQRGKEIISYRKPSEVSSEEKETFYNEYSHEIQLITRYLTSQPRDQNPNEQMVFFIKLLKVHGFIDQSRGLTVRNMISRYISRYIRRPTS